MNDRLSPCLVLLLVAAFAGVPGCDDGTDTTAAPPDNSSAAAATPAVVPGHFTGRVTRADGSPITTPGAEYEININGVTAVGENNRFIAEVRPDGTFKLRLQQGMYRPAYGTIRVPFEGKSYSLWLEPVDPYKATRESEPGIAQNFVWRLTGQRPDARNPEPANATHWFGSTIPLIASMHRNDIGQNVSPLPDGTKLTWSLKPTSKLIDGSDAKPLTIEQTWRADATFGALNDLPPANYEVSAVATLPDGATKTLLLTDLEDDRYKPIAKVKLQPEEALQHYVYLPRMVQWAAE
ncbi:MAG TPA: hypothetical protein VGB55_11415 [Tepidisphaeraceae bacterium]